MYGQQKGKCGGGGNGQKMKNRSDYLCVANASARVDTIDD